MSEADPERMTTPIGERLRKAREACDMSLEDVANRTRIPIRHLQHIENGEWDALPAPTYSIGFARSYAHVVGLNGSRSEEHTSDLQSLMRHSYAVLFLKQKPNKPSIPSPN